MLAGRDMNIVTERVIKKTVMQTYPDGRHIIDTTASKIPEPVDEYVDIHTAAGKESGACCKADIEHFKKRIQ
ncbi:MAG: hypothetical protein JW837_06790 [Sedimentisphaerales bacterium]|nr:hypothetical protein [Sedimentisphaerales bacterium]